MARPSVHGDLSTSARLMRFQPECCGFPSDDGGNVRTGDWVTPKGLHFSCLPTPQKKSGGRRQLWPTPAEDVVRCRIVTDLHLNVKTETGTVTEGAWIHAFL